ncbi:Ger(x)C family spore germination protein [Paenibacillus albus]|uniref:Ger(X)C family spore germination protein n=1 Tax=Paenibacillus albus TaxID=2495582 RepID=A0A3Q8X4Q9_9BACL|nr:Ger(x)C family spore germination protein [Paenibacillus albus]AZN39224.1 Ger(x)C family spore germination protein [Paenibacillus albus]
MIRALKLGLMLVLLLSLATGCWNLREPDELSFIMAAGLDYNEEGKLEVTSQIAVPAALSGSPEGSGGNKKSFIVVSGTGKNVMDAGQSLQAQLPRTLFYAHRQTILLGERLVRNGVGSLTDMFIRNPKSEMRSSILVVKGGTAKDLLNIEPLFDPYISTMLVREQSAVGLKPYYYRQFLSDALSQTIQPLLPAVEVIPNNRYRYVGSAILNKDDNLKLAGYLNAKESSYANWIIGRQTAVTITAHVRPGKEEVSLSAKALSKKLQFKMQDPPRITVTLTGLGIMTENNSSLNPSKTSDLKHIEQALSQETQKEVQAMVNKVQKQYKADVFGFGEYIHRDHPMHWKSLKSKWSTVFPSLRITIKVDLKCKDPGQTNSSIDSML